MVKIFGLKIGESKQEIVDPATCKHPLLQTELRRNPQTNKVEMICTKCGQPVPEE